MVPVGASGGSSFALSSVTAFVSFSGAITFRRDYQNILLNLPLLFCDSGTFRFEGSLASLLVRFISIVELLEHRVVFAQSQLGRSACFADGGKRTLFDGSGTISAIDSTFGFLPVDIATVMTTSNSSDRWSEGPRCGVPSLRRSNTVDVNPFDLPSPHNHIPFLGKNDAMMATDQLVFDLS